MSMYKVLDKCLCCGNTSLQKILDLNDQPLANSYLKIKYRDWETDRKSVV